MKMLLISLITFVFASPTAALADGRIDYRSHCASCHGANAFMAVKMARKLGVDPRKLTLLASEMSREEMIAITETGKGKMPGFDQKLTKEQIADIVGYIQDNRTKKIRRDSLIREKAPLSPVPDPAETPAATPEKPS